MLCNADCATATRFVGHTGTEAKANIALVIWN